MTATKGRRRRRSALVVVAAVALVTSLGGGVTAAGMVTGGQIRDGSVTGRDLRNGSVAGVDVRDGSLSPRDVIGAIVGPPGPQGPAGVAGASGSPGRRGVREVRRVFSSGSVLAPGVRQETTVSCPFSAKVLSGGFSVLDAAGRAEVLQSAPLDHGAGWVVTYLNVGSVDLTGYVWAVCAAVT